jgi:hypothetical protein
MPFVNTIFRGEPRAGLARAATTPCVDLSEEQRHGFDVALNEATLLGAELNAERRSASLSFSVLSLPADGGAAPEDSRIQLILQPVGRLAAALRDGRWDDASAPVRRFSLQQLPEVVLGFEGLPVYGWEFLDRPEDDNFHSWSEHLSLDWRSERGGVSHTLDLFQEGHDRHLDLRIWFDELRIYNPQGSEIAFDDFTSGGARWWEAMYAGDPRTQGHGIVPLAPPHSEP